jgi:hypothetical protein
MRSLADARGTGDPHTDWSFRFIYDPGVFGCVSGARESGKHVETRDVMVIAGGDPGERHKQSFDGKLRIGRREIVRSPRQVARMAARPTRQCDGLVVEPGIHSGLTVKK